MSSRYLRGNKKNTTVKDNVKRQRRKELRYISAVVMAKEAKTKIKAIVQDMLNKYGDEIKPHLFLPEEQALDMTMSSDEEDALDFNDEDDDSLDMYMTGKSTTFVFEGLEKIQQVEGPGPGGGASEIAFTVKTQTKDRDTPGDTQPLTPHGKGKNTNHPQQGQGGEQVEPTYDSQKEQQEYNAGGWQTVTKGNKGKGQESPHRKTNQYKPKDPHRQGQGRS